MENMISIFLESFLGDNLLINVDMYIVTSFHWNILYNEQSHCFILICTYMTLVIFYFSYAKGKYFLMSHSTIYSLLFSLIFNRGKEGLQV